MVREFSEKDIKEVAKIIVDGWKSVYRGMIDDDFLDELNYEGQEKKLKERYINGSEGVVYVIENEIVGYARYGVCKENIQMGEIYALYVKDKYRKKGIGKQLVIEASRKLREKGFDKMRISCLKDNFEARKFYEKIGGKISSEKDFSIKDKIYKEVNFEYEI